MQAAAVDVAQLEHDRRVRAGGHRGPVIRIDVGADHQLRQAPVVDLRHRQCLDHAPGAQDRDAVGDLEDLVQAVRDVEDAGAAALHLAHHRQQPLDLVVGEHRGRLVEHEHSTASVPALKCARDRDDRPLDRRGLGERAMDVDLDVEALEDSVGLLGLLSPANASAEAPDEVAPEREVVHRVQFQHQPEVLMDEPEPVGHRVTERERLAGQLSDGTGVRGVVAGEGLDQGRLPGSVLTDKRVDLTLADLDRRVDQSPCSGKRLREALHEQRRCGGTAGIAGGGFGDQGFLSGLDGLSAVVSSSSRDPRRGMAGGKS